MSIDNEFVVQNNSRILSSFTFQPRAVYKHNQEEKKDDKELLFVKEVLSDIYHRTFITSTHRAYNFKLSTEKAQKVYWRIESEGYVEPVVLNLTGRGGQSKFFWLTEKGCLFIQKPMKQDGKGGRGSIHLFLQYYLRDFLRKRGYEVEIEKQVEGKNVDLFCMRNGKNIAVEVCVSTFSTEYLNVIKDFRGSERVVLICLDSHASKKLIEELGNLKESVEVYALNEFVKEFGEDESKKA